MGKKAKKKAKARHIFLVTGVTYHPEDEPERTEAPEVHHAVVYVKPDDKQFVKLTTHLKATGSEGAAIRKWAKERSADEAGMPRTLVHGWTTITYLGMSYFTHEVDTLKMEEVRMAVIE